MGSTRTPLYLLGMEVEIRPGVLRPAYKIAFPLLSRAYFRGKNKTVLLVVRCTQEAEALPQELGREGPLKEIFLLKTALGG